LLLARPADPSPFDFAQGRDDLTQLATCIREFSPAEQQKLQRRSVLLDLAALNDARGIFLQARKSAEVLVEGADEKSSWTEERLQFVEIELQRPVEADAVKAVDEVIRSGQRVERGLRGVEDPVVADSVKFQHLAE